MQAKWSCLTLKEGFGSDTTGEMSHIIIIINSVQEKIGADHVNQIIMVDRKKTRISKHLG